MAYSRSALRDGSIMHCGSKLRKGSYFPVFLEHPRTAEKALIAVFQEAYVQGIVRWPNQARQPSHKRFTFRSAPFGSPTINWLLLCSGTHPGQPRLHKGSQGLAR
jgi:hypothetical protein